MQHLEVEIERIRKTYQNSRTIATDDRLSRRIHTMKQGTFIVNGRIIGENKKLKDGTFIINGEIVKGGIEDEIVKMETK